MARNKKKNQSYTQHSPSTIVVHNLPSSFTIAQLEDTFSEVGPIRRRFFVTNRGSTDHRGIAYVHFAAVEDAKRAVELKNGSTIGGRKIRVEPAMRRPTLEQRRSKQNKVKEDEKIDIKEINDDSYIEEVKPKAASNFLQPGKSAIGSKGVVLDRTTPTEVKSSEKQRVAKTVIIGGIHNADMAEEAERIARECGECIVTYPLPVQELQRYGLAHDGCKPDASSVLYDSVKSARLCVAKLHQKEICGGIVWARQLGGEGSKTQKWKLIVRNLPFEVRVSELKDRFSSAGLVWDVSIPQKDKSSLAKGFGFVKFTSKQDAESAIKKFNGIFVGKRLIAVDWALPKKIYTSGGRYVPSSEDEQSENDDGDDSSDIEKGDMLVVDESSQPQEIDVASDESDLIEEKIDMDEVNFDDEAVVARKVLEKIISSNSNEVVVSPSDHTSLPDESKDVERISIASKSSQMTLPDGVASDCVENRKLIKPKERDDDLHKTIFISKLPLDIENEEVEQRFSAFGEIQSFRPVLDKVNKRPKGSGFLKFKSEEAADAAFTAANASTGVGVTLKSKQLKVMKALDKQTAQKKKVENARKEDHDHRNLYLSKEGLILEGTPAAEGVSASDMSKRKSLNEIKIMKLRSPNFHVSRTRLVMYNLPMSKSEKDLKKLCIDAVVSRASKQTPVIRQIKILKDLKKGFIEFTEHEHALVALRVLNNNPGTFGPEHRPIVEFAVDNVQILKRRQERNQFQLQAQHHHAQDVRYTHDLGKRNLTSDKSSNMSGIKRKSYMGNKGADNNGDGRANKKNKIEPTSKHRLRLRQRPRPRRRQG